MKKKRAIKKLKGLAVQKTKHYLLSDDKSLDKGEFLRPHWEKEADNYRQRFEEILGKSNLSAEELREIKSRAEERARREYARKKDGLRH